MAECRTKRSSSQLAHGRHETTSAAAARHLPRTVAALGVVSLLMDVSSEMVHGLLPVFLVTIMGASTVTVGLIEGTAEATASITKLFSGVLSDWLQRRKLLVVVGYGLSALTKPLFPLAANIATILAARFFDRVGKGLREAPRDALLAEVIPANMRGSGFGLRQALDTVGAIVGPLTAISLMTLSGDNFRLVFWFAIPPAFLAVAVLIGAVEEHPKQLASKALGTTLTMKELRSLPTVFWWTIAIASVLSLGRFSEAFLMLRASEVGIDAAFVPAVLILMNIVYSATAFPLGALSDRLDARLHFSAGVAILVCSDLVLASGNTIWAVAIGAMLWGLHMGATQGLLSGLVAAAAPERFRGTAFGIFYVIVGIATLLANAGAGALWAIAGASVTFLVGALVAIAAIIVMLLSWTRGQLYGRGARYP